MQSLCYLNAPAQELRKISNDAFQRGEKITYRVYYDAIVTGKVTAGEAELEITDENQKVANRNTMHIVAKGNSKGAFNYFFKVVDRYETIIDENAVIPWVFVRRVSEGNYKKNQDVMFNQISKTVSTNKSKPKNIVANAQDIISALYYARTFNCDNLKKGDSFPISFFLDDSLYSTKIIFQGKESIKTSLGTFNCLKFKPMVLSGKVFKDPYPMTLWISDDKNHVPILAESKIMVGRVKLELTSYSGLKNELTSKLK